MAFLSSIRGCCDTGNFQTNFERLSSFWPAIALVLRKHADKAEFSTAIFALLYYRRWPYKAMYCLGALANLCWLRHYLREVTREHGDRLCAGGRFRFAYSFVQRLVKLEGQVSLRIPIIGTFRIDARFDSMDHQDNTTQGLTTVSSMIAVPSTSSVVHIHSEGVAMSEMMREVESLGLEEEVESKEEKDGDAAAAAMRVAASRTAAATVAGTATAAAMICEEDREPFNEWRCSFGTVALELLDHLEWKKDTREHKAWRESLASVVSQLEELKPYLQVGEEVFHAVPRGKSSGDTEYDVLMETTADSSSVEEAVYVEEEEEESEMEEENEENAMPITREQPRSFVATPAKVKSKTISPPNDSPSMSSALSSLNNFRKRNKA